MNRRVTCLALLSLVLVGGFAQAQGEKPNCYVVSAGIDRYAHPNMKNLQGCVTDARTATRGFRLQQGALFGQVHAHTLIDGKATSGNLKQQFAHLKKAGKAGDYAVIFLSGHGSQANPHWHFCTADFNPGNADGTGIDDTTLLATADALAARQLKVIIIVDACFSGNLRQSGKTILDRYTNKKGGGILLMLACQANQFSNALGKYSAYAEAVAEALAGRADFNHDGKVTIAEARHYAFNRTHQMLRQSHNNGQQDGVVAHSPSLSDNFILALPRPAPVPNAVAQRR